MSKNPAISGRLKKVFSEVSTATIATALFKKGLKNQFIQEVQALKSPKKNMVGRAFTLRYIPAREDRNPIEVFQNPSHPQRVAVENCTVDDVLVIDSRRNPRAASAGSILITRLQQLGASGIVTDGGFRDCGELLEMDFPIYQNRPSAPTNLTLHEAIEIQGPIGCGEVAVFPGDLIVGDADGVMVIPREIEEEIANLCLKMTQYEDFVMQKVKEGSKIIGLYPLTQEPFIAAFDQWLNQQK